ncbi:fluoride efflux transporter CrcB [Halorussus lipolyticus]|uniref:fluoride efflux transporter CrcB n=1 Tax=Halorussus lipolyticus TaxID=3034024 RepID=UPI003075D944
MSETESRSSASGDEADETSNRAASATGRSRALDRLKPILLVAVGGFAGAMLRHAVAVALPGGFPWGTLAVNVAGSFALGVLLFEERLVGRLSAETRLVLGTGLLSSFTTYSTFAVQTAALSPMLAVANVGANYALGFTAVLAGRAVVRSLAGPEVAG